MSNLIHTKQIDPVCGMEVDPAAAAAKTFDHGKMIFFCTKGCKKVFETNPKAYTTAQRKGFWQYYLDRVEGSTG